MFFKKFYIFFIFITLTVYSLANEVIPKIDYIKVDLNSVEDIEKWKNSEELYSFAKINIDLRKFSAVKKKELFVQILLPAIKVVNAEIENNKNIIAYLSQKDSLTPEEKEYAEELFTKYRVEYGNWEELNSQMIIYPTSLILTQGAIESAWGTSRFFREGNNLFGMWSTNPNEPRIAAKGVRDNGFVPHLKKYETVKDSVADIVLTISRNNAYKNVRKLINENEPPEVVATGLIKYSEEGEVYIKKIVDTMNYNNFTEYDTDYSNNS